MKNSIKLLFFLVALMPAYIITSEESKPEAQTSTTEQAKQKAEHAWDVTKSYIANAWDTAKTWTKQAWEKTKEGAENLSAKFRSWWSSKTGKSVEKEQEKTPEPAAVAEAQ